MTTDQLGHWQGEFGDDYTDRNVANSASLVPAFREIVDSREICSVLEVGCNRGHNLVALSAILGPEARLVGVDPNRHALDIARSQTDGIMFVEGSAFELPYDNGEFDLVFTSGVLIHIAPADLPRALTELHRVSGRFLLAIEYFAEEETSVQYRGHEELLWKRDFGRAYAESFPGLETIASGRLGIERGFDNCHWWLLERTGS